MSISQTIRPSCKAALAACALWAVSGCSSDNAVNQFLDDAQKQINSVSIAGTASNAACKPDPYAPAIQDPTSQMAGRTFAYQRGNQHKGKITFDAGGTFNWENEDGTKAGTGRWSTQGAKWCESFDASAHNEAVSSRCWPVINARGALCYGVTRLVPEQATIPPG
ncbi:MAG: hypothetical protein AAGF81_13270 [Pseudomonadota bacterium]